MNATARWLSPPLTKARLQWALLALVATALPFANDLPLWITGLLLVTCVWRYRLLLRKRPLPKPALRFLWTLANFAFVWVEYETINGMEAGTALLIVMAAMKLTESARARDLVVIVYMSLFLIIAHALFDQSVFATLYAVAAAIVTLCALVQISRRGAPDDARRAMLNTGTLALQALPVLLLMFVLFPRVPGPFWSLPSRTTSTTGLSDSMEPGSISNLLQSGRVAFRVAFDDLPPMPAQMYWRGPVLSRVNGRTWTPALTPAEHIAVEVGGARTDYTMTLEPHNRRWLFALDVPAPDSLPAFATLRGALELLSNAPITQRRRYSLGAFTDFKLDRAGLGTRREMLLDTSGVRNPKAQALARQWRNEHGENDAEVIRSALLYFNREPFVYTLSPPLLPQRGATDAFLFDTRRGFCEHYSSAFALLMRYAGIPSRVVTGYQGGEQNTLANHFTVRQSDAHAWTEVWSEGNGWQRVDPTAAVAPERIESGINSALSEGESLTPLILGDGLFFSKLRHTWDALNAAWNERVLGYGQRAQFDILRKLGINAPSAAKLVAVLSLGMIAFLITLSLLLKVLAARRRDPLLRLYDRFCVHLARLGVVRLSHEGPRDFAARAALALPRDARTIETIGRLYAEQRYGRDPDPGGTAQLREQLRQLRRRPARAN